MSATEAHEQHRTEPTVAAADCPLPARDQVSNLLIFSAIMGLVYAGAPVLYVSIAQGALLQKLGAREAVSNLPSSVYFWMTPLPILVAWYFHATRALRPVLATTYVSIAAGGAAVSAVLLTEHVRLITVAVVAHAALLGLALGVHGAFQWELVGKGFSESRRGQALGLAFGIGPILAFLASLGAQSVLAGIAYPWNFAVLFGETVPLMILAAFLSTRYVVPEPASELPRQPLVPAVFGGLGDYLRNRNILFAALALVLVSSGYNVLTNMALFTKEAIGEETTQYAGYQMALRFGCKSLIGLLLGWLLTRTNPKAGLLVTGGFCLASVLWVLFVPGIWFLVGFGLMGVGELFGVYFPNYILSCSPNPRMRRNMAFTSMLNMPSGFSPLVFGLIADVVGAASGDKRLGFQMSFRVSAALLVATLLLVSLALPSRPRPQTVEPEASDPAIEPTSNV